MTTALALLANALASLVAVGFGSIPVGGPGQAPLGASATM
jgi:ABC-type uncharacterized transport system permease subunit